MKSPLLSWIVASLLAIVSATFAAGPAVYEGFDYPASAQLAGGNGGSGFANAWSGDNSFLIIESSLSAGVPTSGRHIQIFGNGTCTRQLSQTIGADGTVRYLSVVAQALYQSFGGPPKGLDRVGLTLNGSSGTGVFFGKVANQFNWAMDNSAGGGQVLGPPMFSVVPSTQVLLVIKCEFFPGNDRFTLYVNPIPGQPEPASGTVKFNSDLGSATSISFTISSLEGSWGFDEIRLASTFADAVPSTPVNNRPTVVHLIPDQNGNYGAPFSYTFPLDSFADSDVGQTLNYFASGLPPGISFDPSARAFSGVPSMAGNYAVTVSATDTGSPALSTNDTFNIAIAKAPLVVSPSNATRPYGEPNPPFSGALTGVTNNDNITASFASSATTASPPGVYQITPSLADPDGRLANYNVTTNLGALTVDGVMLDYSLSNGSASLCWPTSASAFALEYAENLVSPVLWQILTSGISTNGSTICAAVSPASSRYYRLHLP